VNQPKNAAIADAFALPVEGAGLVSTPFDARAESGGLKMKKVVLSVCAALAASAAPALAADLGRVTKAPAAPPPAVWDIAFGGAVMTDYNFRGISQSDRGPAVNAYFEPRFNIAPNWQLYAGVSGYSVNLPTDPSAEIDLYGGIRPTFGPLALDFGFLYYYYPREKQHAAVPGAPFPPFPNGNTTLADTDFWEVYAKATYTFNEQVAVGASVYHSPSWLNTGADGTYLTGNVKLTAPSAWFPQDWGAYLSAEVAHYWLGTTDVVPGVFGPPAWELPDYTYWNIGIAFTWKVFTLDFRYHDTDLSREECNILTADPTATPGGVIDPIRNPGGLRSKWCDSAFIVSLKADLTASANLK
jgi:uncharacterized protein (TIGR02001 family)